MNFSIPDYPGWQAGSVYCIGRNYARHIEEMKSKKTKYPVVFLKPRSSLLFGRGAIQLPSISKNVHHEVELVLLIGKKVRNADKDLALSAIKAIAVGLDITARDIQSDAKQKGLPWSLAKGFDTFAPIGNFVECSEDTDLSTIDVQLSVNGKMRQSGNTSQMLFSSVDLVSYLSNHFTLTPGDLIFTGTPDGVSQINAGDRIEASIQNGLSTLKANVQ